MLVISYAGAPPSPTSSVQRKLGDVCECGFNCRTKSVLTSMVCSAALRGMRILSLSLLVHQPVTCMYRVDHAELFTSERLKRRTALQPTRVSSSFWSLPLRKLITSVKCIYTEHCSQVSHLPFRVPRTCYDLTILVLPSLFSCRAAPCSLCEPMSLVRQGNNNMVPITESFSDSMTEDVERLVGDEENVEILEWLVK